MKSELKFPPAYNLDIILATLRKDGDLLELFGFASEMSLAKSLDRFCPARPKGTGVIKYLKQIAASQEGPEELKHTVYKSEYVYAHKQKDGTIVYLEPQTDDISPMEYAERMDFYTQHTARND